MFKDHPNFNNLKVILEPDLREQLNSSCDVPGDIEAIIYDFSTLFQQVDLSRLQEPKNLWFLQNLEPEVRESFLKAIEDQSGKHSISEAVLNHINATNFKESNNNKVHRICKIVQSINQQRLLTEG